MPDGTINITDLDSRLVHGMRGWVQGYNAQAVCNERQLILAADVMTASPDFGHLGPMITQPRDVLAAAGVTEWRLLAATHNLQKLYRHFNHTG